MTIDAHRLAELRSLELHRAVGRRLTQAPWLVERARDRVESQRAAGRDGYAEAWMALLASPLENLVLRLGEDSEEMRALRQATPFTFVVSARDRWRIWRAVRDRDAT